MLGIEPVESVADELRRTHVCTITSQSWQAGLNHPQTLTGWSWTCTCGEKSTPPNGYRYRDEAKANFVQHRARMRTAISQARKRPDHQNTHNPGRNTLMAESIDATGDTDAMANQIKQAADELESIDAANDKLRQDLENEDWSGLDQLAQTRGQIEQARDQLADVADKIGVGAQIVREARQKNQMVGSRGSLGRS